MTCLERRKELIEVLDTAQASGARLEPACAVVGLSVRTVQHWRAGRSEASDQGAEIACRFDRRTVTRNSPKHKYTPEQVAHVLAAVNSPQFGHLPPSQIVPRLADQGRFVASESTMYRVMRAAGQTRHRRAERRACTRKHKLRAICATAPNQCYTWDITYLPTAILGQHYYWYVVVDLFSRKIVGHAVHETESALHASALIQTICHREAIVPNTLTLHSDNGSPMKGSTMLTTLQALGIAPSRSRPACSNDNPYSESLFRTLKYRPQMPIKPFADLEQANAWANTLVSWYNHDHRHSAIQFVTPAERHAKQDREIVAKRKQVYQAAKDQNPQRWSKQIRNWHYVAKVHLNPEKAKANIM